MRKITFVACAVIAVLFAGVTLHAAEQTAFDAGRKIMEEADSRNSCHYETTNIKMEIIDKRNTVHIRRLIIYKKSAADNTLQTLIRFRAPEDVKGVGLLTIEHADRQSDQWLYLPILRKNKRIAAASKKNSFVGTDFTFEDLQPEDLSRHDYELLREEDFDGQACFVIEATPAQDEAAYSGYKARKIWIKKDIYVPVKIEYSNPAGELQKTESRSKITQVREGLWRADFILMENHRNQQKTTLDVQERDIGNIIADTKFTQVELEQGGA